MPTTQLHEKNEYEKAMDELKKLNEDLFYDDLKEKMKMLESNNKELLEKAVTVINSVSNQIATFTQELSVSDERNRNYLEQNEAFVTLTKKELAKTEDKLAAQVKALQQMDDGMQLLQQSYKEMFKKHSDSINTILVVREEALINKITYQLEYSTIKQLEQHEKQKLEIQQLQEKLDSVSKNNYQNYHSLSTQLSSKEDLVKIEKKSTLKMNILLSIAVIEAILIGIQFFI